MESESPSWDESKTWRRGRGSASNWERVFQQDGTHTCCVQAQGRPAWQRPQLPAYSHRRGPREGTPDDQQALASFWARKCEQELGMLCPPFSPPLLARLSGRPQKQWGQIYPLILAVSRMASKRCQSIPEARLAWSARGLCTMQGERSAPRECRERRTQGGDRHWGTMYAL